MTNPKPKRNIPLSMPDITELEKTKVLEVLDTPFLSRGQKIEEFERKISEYIGVPYTIAVNSGTSALHLGVKSLDLKEGDEVITTPFSFVSSSNCLLMERVKPVFADVSPMTYNINPELIEEKINSKTKAILPVDVFGYPCDIDRINEIAETYGLSVIEDSCEALGAEYKGDKVGKKTDLAMFAFYPNKQITTGEGGIIVTPSKSLADLCRSMRNHGNSLDKWSHCERLGYNYWMDELSASLGAAQMERLDEILTKRKIVADMYREKLKDLDGITLPVKDSDDFKRSWFVFVIQVDERKRDSAMKYLKKQGIGCREYFPVIHLQPLYQRELGHREGDFPVAERISKQSIALPFYNSLKEDDIEYISEKLKEAI